MILIPDTLVATAAFLHRLGMISVCASALFGEDGADPTFLRLLGAYLFVVTLPFWLVFCIVCGNRQEVILWQIKLNIAELYGWRL